jgi:hypothetical protein
MFTGPDPGRSSLRRGASTISSYETHKPEWRLFVGPPSCNPWRGSLRWIFALLFKINRVGFRPWPNEIESSISAAVLGVIDVYHLPIDASTDRPVAIEQRLLLARQTTKAEQSSPNGLVQRRMRLAAKYGHQACAVHPNRHIPEVTHFSELPKQRHKRR